MPSPFAECQQPWLYQQLSPPLGLCPTESAHALLSIWLRTTMPIPRKAQPVSMKIKMIQNNSHSTGVSICWQQHSEKLTNWQNCRKLWAVQRFNARQRATLNPSNLMRSLGLLCILISQLTPLSRQYWCVDPLTGEEQQGTRISSSPIGSALPDCSIRHQCKINCPKELLTRCEHGVKLDHKGCPVDERCECQNPCDVSKDCYKMN